MFQVQEKVEIILKPDDYRFHGTVQYVTERHIVVACPPADSVHCVVGAQLALAQIVEGLYYQFETEILRCEKNSFFAPLLPPQVIQRRRTPRTSCHCEITYAPFHPGISDAGAMEDGEFRGMLMDISTGGAKALTEEALLPGASVRLQIEIEEENFVAAEASVLRCTKRTGKGASESPELPYQTTFRFTALPRLDAMHLTRFIQQNLKAGNIVRQSGQAA